ncbi:MAG TPA: 50S ribosomal protein L11 methyltransferase [Chitinophagaceae bacterium]|nr:50S ribosomal protein L11 methyltransferase [Chitinophagaceae bacterium]
MTQYFKIAFEDLGNEQKEILIALLSEMNYEGFEEDGNSLQAYVAVDLYKETELIELARTQGIDFSITRVENKNWNLEWESNFHPIIIDHPIHNVPWVGIRAEFHEPLGKIDHEIIITPKMSFGTGHHATTSMMLKMMSELEFSEKIVMDFGTGTGILAILAEKLGGSKIIAIDNDPFSIENATENITRNNCTRIRLYQQSNAGLNQQFDIILANIVKIVILENIKVLASQLTRGGTLLLSGLLKDDEKAIVESAYENNLILVSKIGAEGWICLQMNN